MSKTNLSDKANNILQSWLNGDRLPHAILLEGSEGEDTSAFATKIAQGSLCTDLPSARPCEICRDCIKVAKGVHPDVIFYSSQGGSRSLHVDLVREIRASAYLRPNEGRYRVFILENAQNMTIQSQNAMLKIIEEPPNGVIFILICDNKSSLLPTILSRVGALTIASLDDAHCEEALTVLSALFSGDEIKALEILCAYEKDRQGLLNLLTQMKLQVAQVITQNGSPELSRFRQSLGALYLTKIYDTIEELRRSADGNVSGLLLVTLVCSEIRGAEDGL